MPNAPIEPSAALREVAHNLREMFLALVAEGFTEAQALTIVGQAMQAAAVASG